MNVAPRVLSIQSHVVSGYVGNKSAVFPLQVLGFDVDFINSVHFSNHTGYKLFKGQILTEADLADLMQGLSENNLDEYTHLLTGYIGSPSFLSKVCEVVKTLRQKNPNLVFVCDPVMGDNGKLYVKKELIPLYKECILPLTTIITPNLFETETLTDMKIKNVSDVWDAINNLHSKGCETVVISSAELEQKSKLMIFASSQKEGSMQKLLLEVAKLPLTFTGTGDLFASLILAWMHKTSNNLKESLENTVSTLQAVLKRTVDSLQDKQVTPKNLEIKLIQSKQDIEKPKITYEASIIQDNVK